MESGAERMETEERSQDKSQELAVSARSSPPKSGRRTRSARKASQVGEVTMNKFEGRRAAYKNDSRAHHASSSPKRPAEKHEENVLRTSVTSSVASLAPEPEHGAPTPSVDGTLQALQT
jgi:hypothetical protein